LSHRDAAGVGDQLDRLDDRAVALDVEPATDRVGVEALGALTTSWRASMVSSTGVSGSKRWI
jgi:hypothetical protein